MNDSAGGTADEPALIARARSGDRDAMHEIYCATIGAVTAFVARRARAPDVEDVVAETYARAMAGLGKYRDRGIPIRAWLMRIALNLIVDTARSAAARTTPFAAVPEATMPDPTSGWVDRHADTALLRTAFAALEPMQRAAVGMRHLEGLPSTEVSAVLGISDAAVRALVHRGTASLRRVISTQLACETTAAQQVP